MERIATIALLVLSAAGLYILKTDQMVRLQAESDAVALTAAEDAEAAAAAAAAAEAAKIYFVVPHDSDGRTRSIDLVLDGSASADSDLDGIGFDWKITDGPQALITAIDSGRATVRVEPGEYTFVLSVSDTYGSTSTASNIVTVENEPNDSPSAEFDVYLPPPPPPKD
jgi:hypothetical protein